MQLKQWTLRAWHSKRHLGHWWKSMFHPNYDHSEFFSLDMMSIIGQSVRAKIFSWISRHCNVINIVYALLILVGCFISFINLQFCKCSACLVLVKGTNISIQWKNPITMKDRNNIGTLIVATNSYLTYLILINKYMPTVKRKWPKHIWQKMAQFRAEDWNLEKSCPQNECLPKMPQDPPSLLRIL